MDLSATVYTEKEFPTRPIWLLSGMLQIILGYIFVIVFIFLFYDFGTFVVYGGFMLISMPFTFIVTILKLKNFHFAVEKEYLSLKQGIFSKQERKLPYSVIQNAQVTKTIWDRIFGLTTLVIENAANAGGQVVFQNAKQRQQMQRYMVIGFNGNRIVIPGLYEDEAQKLKEVILAHIVSNPHEGSAV